MNNNRNRFCASEIGEEIAQRLFAIYLDRATFRYAAGKTPEAFIRMAEILKEVNSLASDERPLVLEELKFGLVRDGYINHSTAQAITRHIKEITNVDNE